MIALAFYNYYVAKGDDLPASYRFVHDVYVKAGLMLPREDGMRVPREPAKTFIAKTGGEIHATVSVLFGEPLPLAELFDISHLKGRLAELTSFACSQPGLSISILAFCLAYCHENNLCDTLVASLHPKHYPAYRDNFGFKHLEQGMKNYDAVLGAPAIGGYLQLFAC